MGFTVIAVLAGVVVGLAAGGRLRHLGAVHVRWVAALGAGALLQVVAQVGGVDGAAGLACILASYALLMAFGMANIRFVGMPVVLLGIVLNVVVITANGGMPVRTEAILTVDPARTPAEVADLDLGAKRHLETDDDHLTLLGDVLPVSPIGQVLSFGDLILAFGVADVVFRLLRPVRAGRRRRTVEAHGFQPAANLLPFTAGQPRTS
jgi:hypothetical protein